MAHQRISSRRMGIALLVVFLMAGLLVSRLVDVQVVRAAELQEQSAEIRTTSEVIWASRGSIVDSFGNDLATDVDRYDVSADPRRVGDFRRDGETVTVMAAMAEIALITGANADELLYAVNSNPEAHFTYLVKGVSPEDRQVLRELRNPWLQMDLVRERTYPFGPVTANLTGMLGRDEPLAGVERKYDPCLRAINGTATYQKGADGIRLPGTTQLVEEPIHGGDVKLTIDSDLQWYVLQTSRNTAAGWAPNTDRPWWSGWMMGTFSRLPTGPLLIRMTFQSLLWSSWVRVPSAHPMSLAPS
jgi:cell division protein FtsI (penicillin-binding protein 3)